MQMDLNVVEGQVFRYASQLEEEIKVLKNDLHTAQETIKKNEDMMSQKLVDVLAQMKELKDKLIFTQEQLQQKSNELAAIDDDKKKFDSLTQDFEKKCCENEELHMQQNDLRAKNQVLKNVIHYSSLQQKKMTEDIIRYQDLWKSVDSSVSLVVNTQVETFSKNVNDALMNYFKNSSISNSGILCESPIDRKEIDKKEIGQDIETQCQTSSLQSINSNNDAVDNIPKVVNNDTTVESVDKNEEHALIPTDGGNNNKIDIDVESDAIINHQNNTNDSTKNTEKENIAPKNINEEPLLQVANLNNENSHASPRMDQEQTKTAELVDIAIAMTNINRDSNISDDTDVCVSFDQPDKDFDIMEDDDESILEDGELTNCDNDYDYMSEVESSKKLPSVIGNISQTLSSKRANNQNGKKTKKRKLMLVDLI